MKHTLILLLFSCALWGQGRRDLPYTKNILTSDVCVFYTPMFSNAFWGFNLDGKYYISKRFATGISISGTINNRKINNSFSYPITNPVLNYEQYGWVNQFDFVQTKRIKIDFNLNNAIAKARLGNNPSYQFFKGLTSTEVATNYFYLLEPGIDISLRLANSPIFFTIKSKYRFAFGDAKFGTTNQFSNYYFAIGFTLIGSK
jgi:hypothetical protein